MLIFFDPKHGRGGGQVVLEELLRRLSPLTETGLVMPERGQQAIAIPDSVVRIEPANLVAGDSSSSPFVLIANANASFPRVASLGRRLRRLGRVVHTVGIVHNYPSNVAKAYATRAVLRQLDTVIAVEPGLAALFPRADIPPWLTPVGLSSMAGSPPAALTGHVKSYGRPDRTKGLHLLPHLFHTLALQGFACSVALGSALDGDDRYASRLRHSLAPWLEDGARGNDWIQPGDIFVIPSISGEAACLTAQEAIVRGAWVIASRVGLMPYLSPTGSAISTFPVGDMKSAADTISRVRGLDAGELADGCMRGMEEVLRRDGLWFEYVTMRLLQITDGLSE